MTKGLKVKEHNLCEKARRHPTFVMDNDAFSGAIRRRIQIPEPYIYNGMKCTCKYTTIIDPLAYHAQLCSHLGAPRINTHNQIQHEWMKLCRSAKYKVRSEVLNFKNDNESEYDYTRSDIVIDNPYKLCPDHENSKLVLDVVIANAAKAPYNRIKKQGEEAQKAAQHKIDNYNKNGTLDENSLEIRTSAKGGILQICCDIPCNELCKEVHFFKRWKVGVGGSKLNVTTK